MISSTVWFGWVLKLSTFDLQIKDAIISLSSLNFLFWRVYLCAETQCPFSFTFSCTPPPPHLLTSFLSLFPWSPLNSFLPIVGSEKDFTWFRSWPFCGVSAAVWKTTQKRCFATAVIYFAHRYTGFSSAQPGLPLLDSLWGCLQDGRLGVSCGTVLGDWHSWDSWVVPLCGLFTGWPLKSRLPMERCLASRVVPQETVSRKVWLFPLCLRADLTYTSLWSHHRDCLGEGEGTWVPLLLGRIRESADLF